MKWSEHEGKSWDDLCPACIVEERNAALDALAAIVAEFEVVDVSCNRFNYGGPATIQAARDLLRAAGRLK